MAESSERDDGHVLIPGSRRPDGTFRKPIRVRKGYTPPDEMEKYESAGKKYVKKVAEKGVPGAVYVDSPGEKKLTPAQKKNLRRKKNRQAKSTEQTTQAQAAASKEGPKVEEITEKMQNTSIQGKQGKAPTTPKHVTNGSERQPPNSEQGMSKSEVEKKLKALNKRLRQIETLQARVDKGELKPSAEQQAKLNRKADIEKEIECYTAML